MNLIIFIGESVLHATHDSFFGIDHLKGTKKYYRQKDNELQTLITIFERDWIKVPELF